MNLRCIWWYLLCMLEDGSFKGNRQIVLAWYSFSGRAYRRNGENRTAASNLERSMERGRLQCEALAWSLGPNQRDNFFVGFDDCFELDSSPMDVFHLSTPDSGKACACLSVCSPELSAAFSCGEIEIKITGRRRLLTQVGSQHADQTTSVILGLSAYRFRALDFEGSLNLKGEMQPIKGVAYFQHVRSYLPLLPWDWCYCSFPDGSVAGISALRLGRDLLPHWGHDENEARRKINFPIFSRGFFIDGISGSFTRLSRAGVHCCRTESGEIIKRVEASNGGLVRMQWDVHEHDWNSLAFTRKALPLFESHFRYKSSRGVVRNFSLAREDCAAGGRIINIGHCNLERTIGMFI